jgi:hypothetical protein
MTTKADAETYDVSAVWPQAHERLFVEAGPFRGAWAAKRTDERLYQMINGFHEAGDLMDAETRWESRRGLNLIFPIVVSYQHVSQEQTNGFNIRQLGK